MQARRIGGSILTATLVACSSCSSGASKIDNGIRITYSITDSALDGPTAAATAAKVVRKRLELAKVTASVRAEASTLIVDLAPQDAESMARVRDLIARRGKLELKLVDGDAPYMKQLFDRGMAESYDKGPGIFVEIDHVEKDEHHVLASDRETLVDPDTARGLGCYRGAGDAIDGQVRCKQTGRQILDKWILRTRQDMPIPSDHEIVYSRTERDGIPTWVTLYVERAAAIDNSSIESARALLDSSAKQQFIQLQLNDDGTAKLEAFTKRAHHRTVALVLDGLVESAPIVTAPITNGTLQLAPKRDAEILALALSAGPPLPGALREETVSLIKNGKIVTPVD